MSITQQLGYPDWQRVVQWDGGVIWQIAAGTYAVPQVSPVMRVDHWQSIAGTLGLTAGAAAVTMAWYADQAKTAQLSSRLMWLDGTAQATLQLRMVNGGPWCQISIAPIGASFTCRLFSLAASNRAFVDELYITPPNILNIQNQAIAAATLFTQKMGPVLGGRAHLWGQGPTGAGAYQILLQQFNSAGVYEYYASTYNDSNGQINLDVALPASSMQAQIWNHSAGAVNCYANLLHYGGY